VASKSAFSQPKASPLSPPLSPAKTAQKESLTGVNPPESAAQLDIMAQIDLLDRLDQMDRLDQIAAAELAKSSEPPKKPQSPKSPESPAAPNTPAPVKAKKADPGEARPGLNFEEAQNLDELANMAAACSACSMAQSQKIRGTGPLNPLYAIVLDPKDISAATLSAWPPGELGELLAKMAENVLNQKPREIYVAPAIKCAPPALGSYPDLVPKDCQEKCFKILKREIALVNPKVVIAMGLTAAQTLTGSDKKMYFLRPKGFALMVPRKVPLKVTLGLSLIVNEPSFKRDVWEDLLIAKKMAKAG
jgi:DNA polymerase